jgi:hypothetical protein
MSRALSLFNKPQDDSNQRLMRNLLALHEKDQVGGDDRSSSPREAGPVAHDPHVPPKRPNSANPLKRRLKSAQSHKSKGHHHDNTQKSVSNPNNNLNDERQLNSREDLLAEIYDLKKKNLSLEDNISLLKSENQRLESEAIKQQRRIDQLLNLSDGLKTTANNTAQLRKEIEKSILVRQLKSQLNILKTVIVDKENEIDLLKRDMRVTKLKEIENERDEYFQEIQRLLKVIDNLKGELSRERRRREWNCKLAGETGDDLRKEITRLASGYQNILSNLSTKGSSAQAANNPNALNNKYAVYTGSQNIQGPPARPSTAGASRPAVVSSDPQQHQNNPPAGEKGKPRPQSASLRGKDYSTNNASQDSGANKGNKNAIPVATNFAPVGGLTNANNNIESPSDRWIDSFNLDTFQSKPTDTQGGPGPGKPLSEYVNKIGKSTNSMEANEVEDDDEDGEEELPSEKIPVFNHPPPHDPFLEKYHMNDEQALAPQQNQPLAMIPQFYPPQQQQFIPPQQQQGGRPLINHIMSNNSIPANNDNPLQSGDKIQAEYRGKGRWYDGMVKSYEKENNTYTILYDDGDEEKGVLAARVRLIQKKLPEPMFFSGNKIEALYYNGKTWYKGEVKGPGVYVDAKQSYVYDITYSDGEGEKGVLEKNIRSLETANQPPTIKQPEPQPVAKKEEPQPKANSPRTAVKLTPIYEANQEVEGMYSGDSRWYNAIVSSWKQKGNEIVYNLLYEDGDSEKDVPEDRLRNRPVEKNVSSVPPSRTSSQRQLLSESPSSVAYNPHTAPPVNLDNDPHTAHLTPVYKINDIVEAYFADFSQWFRGKILQISFNAVTSDISYHIRYDDGDEEKDVPATRLRYFEKFKGEFVFQYQLHDKVEVRYHSGKDFYSGKVIACHKDEDYGPVYDILYDDGDKEKNVKEYNVRSKDHVHTGAASKTVQQKQPSPAVTPTKPVTSETSNTNNNNNNSKTPSSSAKKDKSSHTITTNLDSFLNDLSDDEDENGDDGFNTGLDSGKQVELKATKGKVVQETINTDEEYNEDEFDA